MPGPTMSTKSVKKTTFLSLPAELRNVIYTDMLVRNKPIQMSDHNNHDGIISLEPALLAVSRQIRSEALEIYYGENTFKSVCNVVSPVEQLLGHLGQHRTSMIKSLLVADWPLHWISTDKWLRHASQIVNQVARRSSGNGLRREAVLVAMMEERNMAWKRLADIGQFEVVDVEGGGWEVRMMAEEPRDNAPRCFGHSCA